ncbi:YdcH family protein [Piscinibacterium candidicorallinum]|uniref:YdcH family protein n=1 Tax=Piscinibacterium candidicorallinum TaxID=1793872 RepID=A0ABV7GZ65_9BURK
MGAALEPTGQISDNSDHSNDLATIGCFPVSDVASIHHRIVELELEHRELDRSIEVLMAQPVIDELMVKRMKKRKLLIKDQITFLRLQLTPDIPA